jgi:RNA polymerase sigma-70 factor (ECF subfamily)
VRLRLLRGGASAPIQASGTGAGIGEGAGDGASDGRVPRGRDELAALVGAARQGRADGVRGLVSAVGPSILTVIRRVLGARHPDVEDVAQEAAFGFLAALEAFRGECSVRHFACRIAVLAALKRRRADAALAAAVASPEDVPDGSPAASPLADLVAARRRTVLRALLGDLPLPQAEALILHLLLGRSIAEIAATVGAPQNTVRSRLRLGKEALRARIAGDPALRELLSLEEAGR